MKKTGTTSSLFEGDRRARFGLAKPVLSFVIAVIVWGVSAWGQSSSALQIVHTVDRSSIMLSNENGVLETVDGLSEVAHVALTLRAGGDKQGLPLELALVVDRSATADIRFVREIGEAFLNALGKNDRIALISFAQDATVDVALTASRQLFRDGLDGLRNIGKTAVGDGLFAATQHLLKRGRSEALWVEVLVTDGRANAGRNPRLQAQLAADNAIQVDTVGTGRNPDEGLLQAIAEAAGGSFFREFSPVVIDEIFAQTTFTVAANDLTVVETLAPGVVYEQASLNPPTRVERDPLLNTTTLRWDVPTLAAGESWATRFAVSATQEGTLVLNQAPSEVAYVDFRNAPVRTALPTLQLNVLPPPPPNVLPVAAFSFSPPNPSTQTDVVFDNASNDPDGQLTSYAWDFGDGTSSSEQNPVHRYESDGLFEITLVVSDDRGGTQRLTRTVVVETKPVTVVRSIDTFLPTDVTLPGQTFRVTLTIEVNTLLNGMGVNESINESVPDGWVITPVNNGGARYKEIVGTTSPKELQWVFLEVLSPGDTRTVSYEISVPDNAPPDIFLFRGVASSASPRLEAKTTGDGQIEIKDSLPIATVISRWDPLGGVDENGGLNLRRSNKISFEQVQVAVGWWLNNEVVAYSGNKRIDFTVIQAVIAYWLTGTPIDKPLPGSEKASHT